MTDAAGPFTSILVPYDGSEPAQTALAMALAIVRPGTTLTVLNVVDEAPVMAQSSTTVMAFDPTPLFDALDREARALIADAVARCAAAGVKPRTEIVHDGHVAGIASAANDGTCDLIVMGTHARTGLARAFLGSTTVGVLQSSDVPVLTTREADTVVDRPFATVLVAVDESDAGNAALALASRMAQALGSHLVVTNVADTSRLYDEAATYGFNPGSLEQESERGSAGIVASALARAHIATASVDVALVEGRPAAAILDAASAAHAGAIVMGTHGRRGLRRLFLGSVAEAVVRESPVPVLVVRKRDA